MVRLIVYYIPALCLFWATLYVYQTVPYLDFTASQLARQEQLSFTQTRVFIDQVISPEVIPGRLLLSSDNIIAPDIGQINLKLLGTILHNNERSAFIRNLKTNTVTQVFENSSISSWRVVTISKEKVILINTKGNRKVKIELNILPLKNN